MVISLVFLVFLCVKYSFVGIVGRSSPISGFPPPKTITVFGQLWSYLFYEWTMVFLVCHVLLFASILINLAVCCRKKNEKKTEEPPKEQVQGYKPGHLPLFIDPAEKASDTFYDLKTNLAFPPKDNVSFNSKEGWQAQNNAGNLQPPSNAHDELKVPTPAQDLKKQ